MPRVALETTLLAQGVPEDAALPLALELEAIVRDAGAEPALIGLLAKGLNSRMDQDTLTALLAAKPQKLNTANLGIASALGLPGATTVSATVEVAAARGIRWMATGGLGGVHRGYADSLDISADLAALARFPVAVVASGVKSLLDVTATRELLETLGIPVLGWKTDRFPAFYLTDGGRSVDATFDNEHTLASVVRRELCRTRRGVLIVQPPPAESVIDPAQFAAWLEQAETEAAGATERDTTPAILAALHRFSDGQTLKTNLSLVRANVALAARLATA